MMWRTFRADWATALAAAERSTKHRRRYTPQVWGSSTEVNKHINIVLTSNLTVANSARHRQAAKWKRPAAARKFILKGLW